MSVEWCPTIETTKYFLTKPNQGYIFKIFRDLIMGVMPQIEPSNGKQGNRNKSKQRKLISSKKRSGRHYRYQKRPQECVADRRTDGDKIGLELKQD